MPVIRGFGDCPDCSGLGVGACSKKCERCRGEGVIVVNIDEDVFFADLPPGWSRADAKDLLNRIRVRRTGVSP